MKQKKSFLNPVVFVMYSQFMFYLSGINIEHSNCSDVTNLVADWSGCMCYMMPNGPRLAGAIDLDHYTIWSVVGLQYIALCGAVVGLQLHFSVST